jgi:tetratricopeptide (TPR) repeat protein
MHQLEPDNQDVRLQIADKLREIGRFAESEKSFADITPEALTSRMKGYYYLGLGRLYQETGRYDEAESYYRMAAAEKPESTVSWVFLGALLSVKGKTLEALDVYMRARSAKGDIDEVLFNIACCYRTLGKLNDARDYYVKAQAAGAKEELVAPILKELDEVEAIHDKFDKLVDQCLIE